MRRIPFLQILLVFLFGMVVNNGFSQIDFSNFNNYRSTQRANFEVLRSAGLNIYDYGANSFRKELILWEIEAHNDGDLQQSFKEEGEGLIHRSISGFPETPWEWDEIGPESSTTPLIPSSSSQQRIKGTGRVHFLEEDPSITGRVFCGSTTGGLFISTNNGDSWENVPVRQASGEEVGESAQHIQISHSDPNVWFLATGSFEGWSRTYGVLRTMDNGQSWEKINQGLPISDLITNDFGNQIRYLMIDPNDHDHILAGLNEGVYETKNATAATPTWEQKTTSKVFEMDYDPNSSFQTLYASGDDVHVSYDGGDTWAQMPNTNQLGLTGDGKILIDVIESPFEIYAATSTSVGGNVRAGKIFRFNDSTLDWDLIVEYNPSSSHPANNLRIREHCWRVCPTDPNTMVWLDVSGVRLSTDGGLTSTNVYTSHDDGLWCSFSDDGNTVWIGTDGGLDRSLNKAVAGSWEDITNGIGVANVHNFSHGTNSPYKIPYGAFDTGTPLYIGEEWVQTNIFGDSFDCFYDDSDPDNPILYASVQSGIRKSLNDGLSYTDIDPSSSIAIHPTFYLGFVGDRLQTGRLYLAGIDYIARTTNAGFGWSRISHQVNDVVPSRQWYKVWNSRFDEDILYANVVNPDWMNPDPDGFQLWKQTDPTGPSGVISNTWEDITPTLPTLNGGSNPGLWIADLTIDENDPNKIWIVHGGHTSGIPKVMYYDGTSWTDITGEDSDYSNTDTGPLRGISVRSIEKQPNSSRIYIGTSHGVFYKDDDNPIWTQLDGLPHVRVRDMEIHDCADKLRVGLYGRGMWEGDLLPGDPMTITTTTWSGDVDLTTDLVIPAGEILTVTGTVNIPRGHKIVVEAGAQLIVDGGTLTNSCGLMWKGVEVEGTWNAQQNLTNQGRIVVKNGATIENAFDAISLIGRDAAGNWDWNTVGGIVHATNSHFLNNRRAIEFMPYHNMNSSGIEIDNISVVDNCVFETSGKLNDGSNPSAFITMVDVTGIDVRGCDFINSDPDDEVQLGIGILSIDARYDVVPRCTSVPPAGTPCPELDLDKNTFTRLYAGIVTTQGIQSGHAKIDDNIFTNCTYGIRGEGSEFLEIINNTMFVPTGDFTFPYHIDNFGVYLDDAEGFKVEANQINHSGTQGAGDGRSIGVYSARSTSTAADVYLNQITGLETGVQTGTNSVLLQIDCNQFSRTDNTNADIHKAGFLLADQGVCDPDQPNNPDLPVANKFFGTCVPGTIKAQVYSNGPATFRYESHDYATMGIDFGCIVGPILDADCGPHSNLADACESTQAPFGLGFAELLIRAMDRYDVQVARLQEDVDLYNDGDTEALLDIVENGSPGASKDAMLVASPYVTDEVLKVYFEGEPSNGHTKQVALANSPLSDDIYDVVDAMGLPSGIMNEINDAQTGELSERDLLDQRVAMKKHLKLSALNDVARVYIENHMVDEAMDFLAADGSVEGNCMKMSLVTKKEPALAEAHIVTLRAMASDLIEKGEIKKGEDLQGFCDFNEFLLEIVKRPGGYLSISPEERFKLEGWASSSFDVSVRAQAILNFLDQAVNYNGALPYIVPKAPWNPSDYNEPITEEEKVELSVVPNPFSTEVTISGLVPFDFDQGIIEVVDLSGKSITTLNLSSPEFKFDLDMTNNSKGIYIYTLTVDGVVLDSGKLVKQ